MARKPSKILSIQERRELKKTTTAEIREAKAEIRTLAAKRRELEKLHKAEVRGIDKLIAAQEKAISRLEQVKEGLTTAKKAA